VNFHNFFLEYTFRFKITIVLLATSIALLATLKVPGQATFLHSLLFYVNKTQVLFGLLLRGKVVAVTRMGVQKDFDVPRRRP
jgi:hypothetical protein